MTQFRPLILAIASFFIEQISAFTIIHHNMQAVSVMIS